MSRLTHSSSGRRSQSAVLVGALCIVALLCTATRAAEPVLNEQDINEQSVTRALEPDKSNQPNDSSEPGDNVVTRGFVLSNKQPSVAPRPTAPSIRPRSPTARRLRSTKSPVHCSRSGSRRTGFVWRDTLIRAVRPMPT
jgi:hypothetical protein